MTNLTPPLSVDKELPIVERELVERLTYLIRFYIYSEADKEDVQALVESLSERDSSTGKDGWVIVREDEFNALSDTAALARAGQ